MGSLKVLYKVTEGLGHFVDGKNPALSISPSWPSSGYLRIKATQSFAPKPYKPLSPKPQTLNPKPLNPKPLKP